MQKTVPFRKSFEIRKSPSFAFEQKLHITGSFGVFRYFHCTIYVPFGAVMVSNS
jgi:hypothetical protein